MNIRNEIKSYIVREGLTMSEVVDRLAEEHGWSSSVPNFSGKLQRGSLRYSEAKELAEARTQMVKIELIRNILRIISKILEKCIDNLPLLIYNKLEILKGGLPCENQL